ncbi:hypothetical protein [Saccharicrinis aurantiacus]|uniref:hypothetical protein n=1 Tax=Saccharicrinis aurantiacus TaxID=1849719 RepID=UPI00249353FD|nr:hypothetical protein [Saccharicrinis aurantiacus]
MTRIIKYLFILTVFVAGFSCEREYSYNTGAKAFEFSVDTLMFDTVFSEIGSATLNFKIYNPHPEDFIIDKIELAGGDVSEFRLNINGFADNKVENLRINANDSLYVFVDVTIKPDETNNPFVVNDSIIVVSGALNQQVQLLAYGQNVEVLKKHHITESTTFTNEKPYLIFDYAVVDENVNLTIESGTSIHLHNDASLIVFGSMQVDGTFEEPVLFQGHRLEEFYKETPGQWNKIHFMPGSKDNSINFAEVKNSIMGIVVDSVGLGNDQPFAIDNTLIDHASKYGLIAQNSNITASNLVIGHCGIHSLALTFGGTYNFYHSTIANYFSLRNFFRNTPALLLNNYFIDDDETEIINPLLEANFYNSIIYGNNTNEIGLDFKEYGGDNASAYNYYFESSAIKSGSTDISNEEHFKDVIANTNPNFIAEKEFNYQLDTLSICKDAANVEISENYPTDILNTSRLNDQGPDMGAYERIEEN